MKDRKALPELTQEEINNLNGPLPNRGPKIRG